MSRYLLALLLTIGMVSTSGAIDKPPLVGMDVFELRYASSPLISPDGKWIAYTVISADVQTDRFTSSVELISTDGKQKRVISEAGSGYQSPAWAPNSQSLALSHSKSEKHHLAIYELSRKRPRKVLSTESAARGLVWSRDGTMIAFHAFVKVAVDPIVKRPEAPNGAEWAPAMEAIDKVIYRRDGLGYVKDGNQQVFILEVDAMQSHQLTKTPFDHAGRLQWLEDDSAIILSGQLYEGWEYSPRDSNLYQINVETGVVKQLTTGDGPENDPSLSPDGKRLAYIGFVDDKRSFQPSDLYVMGVTGGDPINLTKAFDRSVSMPRWNHDGSGIYVRYDDHGVGKIGLVPLNGKANSTVKALVENVGGTAIGRPYSGGSFSACSTGKIAYTITSTRSPADVAVISNGSSLRLTTLQSGLTDKKSICATERITYKSSFDGRPVDGWIVYPPGYRADKRYPLILEIHGGPFANYGSRFAMEPQLYASAGYVVLYTNPRGSTSYGEEFTDLLDKNYPQQGDFEDLMSGVDEMIDRGIADEERLYVTGGSGGGILTAWLVCKTDRFKAAVSQKPVINWQTLALTSDGSVYFSEYWFSGPPWTEPQNYSKRSPITYVDQVKTPTMLMTGEQDWRTPISEAEQFYQGLRLNQVDSVLVRVPESSHAIAARPSRIMMKVAHVLAWFERYP